MTNVKCKSKNGDDGDVEDLGDEWQEAREYKDEARRLP